MVSSVKSLPNHYQALGLAPTATEQEIAQAFTRAMSMFGARSLGAAARIGAAFEVLRNPAKRREYDRSMGLLPQPRAYQLPIKATMQANGGFMGSAWANLAKQVAAENPPAPLAEPHLQTRLERGAQPKIGSFIASSLREPPNPRASELARAKPSVEEKRQPEPDAALERHVAEMLAVPNGREEAAFDNEVRTIQWKGPALALAGIVVAAGLIGTLAGLWVQGSGSDEAPQPQAAVSMSHAKAPTNSVTIALPVAEAAPTVSQPQLQPQQQAQPHVKIAVPTSQVSVAEQPVATPDEVADSSQPAIAASSEQVQAAADQLAGQAPGPAAASASMPLPNATITRTIEKIGYSCGTVASIATIEGASPGVFRVNCSSGQDYRATPVNGRYHFRKLGGR